MTTDNEALRKRAGELATRIYHRLAPEEIFPELLAFAAERESLAREAAIAQAAKVCRDIAAAYEKSEGNEYWCDRTPSQYGTLECAEAIERLSPAGERVMVPREPSDEMLRAGALASLGKFLNRGDSANHREPCELELIAANAAYKAMLAAAERKN